MFLTEQDLITRILGSRTDAVFVYRGSTHVMSAIRGIDIPLAMPTFVPCEIAPGRATTPGPGFLECGTRHDCNTQR